MRKAWREVARALGGAAAAALLGLAALPYSQPAGAAPLWTPSTVYYVKYVLAFLAAAVAVAVRAAAS